MNKFSSNNRTISQNTKFGLVKSNSFKQIASRVISKANLHPEIPPENIPVAIPDEEEIPEDIPDAIIPEVIPEVIELLEEPVINISEIHLENVKMDEIIPIDTKPNPIPDDKQKRKSKMADAIKLIVIKKRNGW